MSVAINSTRKAVEISWDPNGSATEPPPEEKPPGYPAHPIHRPDLKPDQGLPGDQPEVTPPIYLPPYIWGPNDPRPGTGLPEGPQTGDHPDHELPEVPKPPDFDTGNLPPFDPPDYVAPVNSDGSPAAVQVFAQGQDGDWSNTDVTCNDGLAVLAYPQEFTGDSYVEVRALDGTLIDSGTISVA